MKIFKKRFILKVFLPFVVTVIFSSLLLSRLSLGDFLPSYNPEKVVRSLRSGEFSPNQSVKCRFTEIYVDREYSVIVCENSKYRLVFVRDITQKSPDGLLRVELFDKFKAKYEVFTFDENTVKMPGIK